MPAMFKSLRVNRSLSWLLAFFAVLHVVVCLLDAHYPLAFLRADRGLGRWTAIEGLLRIQTWRELITYLGHHGNLGDYVPQALLYALGGRSGMIGCQVLVMLWSGACVFQLAKLTGLTERKSLIAAGIYLVSPHSLVFPHQLSSEAIYVPLLVISTWMTCDALSHSQPRRFAGGALLMGVATLVRPITLLWPAVAAAVLSRFKAWRLPLGYMSIAYLPVILWMAFIGQQTGSIGFGASDHSLSVNLRGRVEHIADTLPEAQRAAIIEHYLEGVPEANFSTAAYLSFSMHYPLPLLRYVGRDAISFLSKSGVERITIDYFASDEQVRRLQNTPGDGWRTRLDRYGAIEAARYGWHILGPTFVVSVVAAIPQTILVLLAFLGAIRLIALARSAASTASTSVIALLIVALPIYVFAFSLIVIATQSRQRAPAEFAIAILALHGCSRRAVPRAP